MKKITLCLISISVLNASGMDFKERENVTNATKVASALIDQAMEKKAETTLAAIRRVQETTLERDRKSLIDAFKTQGTTATELATLLYDGKVGSNRKVISAIAQLRLLYMLVPRIGEGNLLGAPIDVTKQEGARSAWDQARSVAQVMSLAHDPKNTETKDGLLGQARRLSITNAEVASILFAEDSGLSPQARELYFGMLNIALTSSK